MTEPLALRALVARYHAHNDALAAAQSHPVPPAGIASDRCLCGGRRYSWQLECAECRRAAITRHARRFS